MKTPTWVYVVIVILSAGAGLAIAGIPDTSPREPTIIPPATTEAPDPLESLADAAEAPGVGDDADDDAGAEADAGAGDAEAAETTTTVETTTTTTTVPLPERGEVEITVANGADIGGVATGTSDRLAELGYTNTLARDGTDIVGQTLVYVPDDLLEFAERLADDLGLPGGRVQDIARAPEVESSIDPVVILYLGSDIELVLG